MMYEQIKKLKTLPKDPVLAHRLLIDKILEILSAVAHVQKRSDKEVEKLGLWIKILFVLLLVSLFKNEIFLYLNSGFQIFRQLSPDSYFQILYVVPITALLSILAPKLLKFVKNRLRK